MTIEGEESSTLTLKSGKTPSHDTYALLCANNLTLNSGTVVCLGGTESNRSFGALVYSSLIINGGSMLGVGGSATCESCGIDSNGFTMNDGKVTGMSGDAGSNSEDGTCSYGISITDGRILGGTLKAVCGTAKSSGAVIAYGSLFVDEALEIKRGDSAEEATVLPHTSDEDIHSRLYVPYAYISLPEPGYVAQIGEEKYETIEAALEAAGTEKTTITLLQDTEGFYTIEAGQDITLDMDGKTLNNGGFNISGTLTLCGEGTINQEYTAMQVDGGTLTVNSGTVNAGVAVNLNNGTVTVEDGSFETGGAAFYINSGTLTFAGGSATAEEDAIYMNGGELNLQGGKIFSGDIGAFVKGGTVNLSGTDLSGVTGIFVSDGTANVTGGKLSGTDAAAWVNGGSFTVSGGAISGDITTYGGTLSLSGGIYTVRPEGGWLAADYLIMSNPDESTAAQYPYAVLAKEATYTVTVIPAENGSVYTSKEYALPGDTVNVRVSANEGYEFVSVKAEDTEGTPIELTESEKGQYTFVMPARDVTVTAVFQKEPDPCEGYTDIDRGAWYHTAADFVIKNGYMGSTKADALTFEPNTKVSRAMVASILYRLAGSPDVEYQGTFTDVPAGKWYSDAIEWCAQKGLASGKGNGKFDPNGYVTRQELAVFMKKMAGYCGADVSQAAELGEFPDADKVPAWAKDYVAWAVAAGILSGKFSGGKTYLAPTDNATRAEFASIIMRFDRNFVPW